MSGLTVEAIEAAICEREPEFYVDHQDWAWDCDGVSHAIVRSGIIPGARVARGTHPAVDGPHSWVVCPSGGVLDCTLWSYDDTYPVVYAATGEEYREAAQ